MDKNQIIDLLKSFLIILKRQGIHIDNAILYGSYSKGENQDKSDIDLMLISKEFDILNDELAGLIWKISNRFDHRIEPFLIGLNKFNTDKDSPLIQDVKETGIVIM